MDFPAWYRSTHHDRDPFPWQRTLADSVADGRWPEALTPPTGCGKTAVLAVWLWALEEGLPVPRRLVYVVDRQLIVDSTADYAGCLARRSPLAPAVVQMRGGITIDDAWLDPARPAMIVSTVDQAGSRLLFSGYGISPRAAPIHAGLLGNDVLWVIDEVHLAQPLLRTLSAVQRLRGSALPLPFRVVIMSATWRGMDALELSAEDLADPVLRPRLTRPKPLTIRDLEPDSDLPDALVKEARALRASGRAVVAIVANTVRTARRAFDLVRSHGEAVLLTGQVRKPDREALLSAYLDRIVAGSRQAGREPLYVVATQTIEVGADLDFDALVAESAPLSALLQRAGRLNRLGELDGAPMVIVHQLESQREKDQREAEKKVGRESHHTLYRRLALETRKWLKKNKVNDFAVQTVMDKARRQPFDEGEVPSPDLLEAHLDLLSCTSVNHGIHVAPWLHGYPEPEWTVFLCWRHDASPQTVQAAPPLQQELLEVTLRELQRLPGWQAVRWDGTDAYRIDPDARRIPPGSTLVLDAAIGGCDPFGWNPESREPVTDYGNTETRLRLLGPDDSDWHALARAQGMTRPGRVLPYPGGALVLAASEWTSEVAIRPVTLSRHLRAVRARARVLATAVGLPDALVRAVAKAAAGHDVGKLDPRWQARLGGSGGPPLAKGPFEVDSWRMLPRGWRHEMDSAQRAREPLVRHLIGSHHGYGRPTFPAAPDPELWRQLGGWAKQFDRLQREHGHCGLAFLEALVRIADWQISEEEQRDDYETDTAHGAAA